MAPDLKEEAARKILKLFRSQGHVFIELRSNGRKYIFFCTLCLAQCYGDTDLTAHLMGNLHKVRLECAKVTLLKPNPWPFSDGLVFFDTSPENDTDLGSASDNISRVLKISDKDDLNKLAIVNYVEPVQSDAEPSSTDEAPDDDGTLIIPDVLMEDEPLDVKIKEVGLGKIAARFFKEDDAFNGVSRIWCEWLGNENNGLQDGVFVPDHDYAVVIFSYNYILGRTGLLADIKELLPSASVLEPDNVGESSRKRKMSDCEDPSYSLSNRCDSFVNSSPASSSATSTFSRKKKISRKAERKELRRKQRAAAEKMCNICQQKMLAGKDVAAFLNLKTRKIVCSSRNRSKAFHVFHVSCVIHWILLCEYHIITDRLELPKVSQGTNKKVAGNDNETGRRNYKRAADKPIRFVFCPECSASGTMCDTGGLERAGHDLQQNFNLKIKLCGARKEWIKSPEVLQNCSVGFHFPPDSEEIIEEKVEPVKLLHFYRADQSRA